LEQMGLLKRAELQHEFRQVKLRAKKLQALHSIGTAIASALDLEAVLTRIVEAAVFITDAEQGSLLLLDEQTKALNLRAQKSTPAGSASAPRTASRARSSDPASLAG
jgi:GAF domain-containing protein